MVNAAKKIGVLALQGDFIEHIAVLRRLGVETREVRLPQDLQGLAGLIIPGGESTTIGKLAASYGLMDPLRKFGRRQAMWGTCAGMILLAKDIGMDQPLLSLMDIKVQRNAFGRQKESFRSDITVPVLEDGRVRPFPALFIRAPKLLSANGKAKAIAFLPDGTAVAAREGKWLVTSFHPELTSDDRFHRYFLGLV
jgi:5'-phosphate synthase pdxT subunit